METTRLIKEDLYAYLSTTEDKALARRALDLSITDEPGATNTPMMIDEVAILHPDLAFDFAVVHLAQLHAKIDETASGSYYPALGRGSLDPAMIDKIKAFAEAHIAASSRHAAETAISQISNRIRIRDERLPAMDAWLNRKQ